MSKNEVPFDTWTEVPDEVLAKKGRTAWVYRPSNGKEPLAIEAMMPPEGYTPVITLIKEQAKQYFFPEKRNES